MTQAASYPPLDLLSRVLYRDAMLLIIDKPAGIAVHQGPGKGDHLENHFDQLMFGLPRVPALAHRLDRDTSGCLVLGRHRKALRKAGELFSGGRAQKTYWALCAGQPPADSGVIDAPLRKKNDRWVGWEMEVVDAKAEKAQEAVTEWRLLATTGAHSLVEFSPKTGRTHQIRVHAQHAGFPLVGDPRYFAGLSDADRALPICLHAAKIVLPYQASKPPIVAEAPLPEAFAAALRQVGLDPAAASASVAA